MVHEHSSTGHACYREGRAGSCHHRHGFHAWGCLVGFKVVAGGKAGRGGGSVIAAGGTEGAGLLAATSWPSVPFMDSIVLRPACTAVFLAIALKRRGENTKKHVYSQTSIIRPFLIRNP